ncbi:GAF and ANTAR domain-containing protein [Mycobacterium sp. SMC-4]|uniref:GAF and ANTAR domain-containing protein n=1 Tax=Mycobacterium sp. SMC-4 TaxID=2857059 RepID=UPI0021B2ADD9|nr:GAF and ANTAR domain-containing protein [Mycobacterium sp. SMC-4]UXA21327.1 GAF and ANTAR domain-containing protein [Mycobacterium sp. SMC-4]
MSIRDALLTAMGGERGLAAADRLCQGCVALLKVDAAAICLVCDGVDVATLGASSPAARLYDELQFTLGEGPGLDAAAQRLPVLIDDLADSPGGDAHWLGYGEALLAQHIRSVYAVPIIVAGHCVGALAVFHAQPPAWTVENFDGVAEAAELAQLPILDLHGSDLDAASTDPGSAAWTELDPLTRSEVSNATGMLMSQLNITAATAVARLRAHAFATGRSATSVARDVIDRRVQMESD